MVNIPSDLRKNKETIIGNLNIREFLCLILALTIAILILYYGSVILRYKRIVILVFISIPFTLPFLIFGFKNVCGMKIDDYFKVFVNNYFLAKTNRLNINKNSEEIVKNKKYEIIRYYKLVNNIEVLKLREHLKNKQLILTEYIDYGEENIVIFRLDGKDLIMKQINRNKKRIKNKKEEIAILKSELKVLKNKNIDKIREIKNRINKLRIEKNQLFSKTFNDIKDEVDIFEDLDNVSAVRINTTVNKKINSLIYKQIINNDKNKIKNDAMSEINTIKNLQNSIKSDERKLYQLHLFEKSKFRNFIESKNNKIVYINKNDEVDVYTFNESIDTTCLDIVDLNEINKTLETYKQSILLLEARNYYNHYRKINSLMEII